MPLFEALGMNEPELTVRPVLFESQVDGYEYWGKGSSVLVCSDQNIYWVTASHVMENQGVSAEDLRIFPTEVSLDSVPYNELIRIARNEEREDFSDLYMLKVDLKDADFSEYSDLRAWKADRDFYDNRKLIAGDELFIMAYPSEKRYVDYEVKRIHFARVVLRAVYQRKSVEKYCHTVKLESSIELENLDGLSGGMVFRRPRRLELPPQFVGLVVRGTAESGFVSYIDCAVIYNTIRLAENA